MKNGFSDQVKAVVEEVLAGEIQISYDYFLLGTL